MNSQTYQLYQWLIRSMEPVWLLAPKLKAMVLNDSDYWDTSMAEYKASLPSINWQALQKAIREHVKP